MSTQNIPTSTDHREALSLIASGTLPLIRWCRSDKALAKSVEDCLTSGFQRFKMEGTPEEIQLHLNNEVPELLAADIMEILVDFCKITGESRPLLELSVVTDNRCRRFHTDLTDYRLICTYSGPATLWIVDPSGALDERKGVDVVPVGFQTEQASAQDVLIFAGAMALNSQCAPLLHKSPALVDGQRRLMLRIDTQCFASIVKGFAG